MASFVQVVVPGHNAAKVSLAGVNDETDLLDAIVKKLRGSAAEAPWLPSDVAARVHGGTLVLKRIAATAVAAFRRGDDARVERSDLPAIAELTAADAILALVPAGGARAAPGGGGISSGGGASAAGNSAVLPGGSVTPELTRRCIESAFAVLADGVRPVCCGFFISPTTALTTYRPSEPAVGARVLGQRFDPEDGSHRGERLHLVAERVDASLGVVLLRLVEGQPPAAHFVTVPAPRAGVLLLGQHIAVVGLGIPAAVDAGEKPGELFAGLSWQSTTVNRVGKRHFAYSGAFGPGDSGSALVLAGHEVVGMHLAGWNYAPEEQLSIAEDGDGGDGERLGAAAAGGQAADLKRLRAEDRVVAVIGHSATKSVADSFAKLASSLTVGGWALSLVSPAFDTFVA